MNTICPSFKKTCTSDSTDEGAHLGWRYAAITRAKTICGERSESNDDLWLIRYGPDHLNVAVIDVASNKRGISGIEVQEILESAFRETSVHASPAEVIALAHAHLAAERARRQAQGVACFMIARLARDGEVLWAHVGDAALCRWRPQTWWRRSGLGLLNARHRQGQGLTQSVGTRAAAGPRIEEGCFKARPGERLLLASDGVFHDAIGLKVLKRWIDAHHRSRGELLPIDLVRKVESEARFTQLHADDSTLLLVERAQS